MSTTEAEPGRLSAGLRARQGLLYVVAGAVLWGTVGVLVRFVHDRAGLSAVSIGFYRLLIGSLALSVWQARPSVRLWRRCDGFQRLLILGGGAGLGIYQALYFAAVQDVGVSTATLVSLGVAPVVLTGWASVVGRRLPSVVSVLTLACALSGLVLVCLATPTGHSVAPHPALGVLEAVGSGVGYAVTTIWNRRLTPVVGAVTLTAVTSTFGALVLLPLAAWSGLRFAIDPAVSGGLVYLGVISTAVAYALFFTGLRSTPSEVAAVLTLLEPLTATVLAVLFLDERLTPVGGVGALLLLAGVAVLCLRPPAVERPATAALPPGPV